MCSAKTRMSRSDRFEVGTEAVKWQPEREKANNAV